MKMTGGRLRWFRNLFRKTLIKSWSITHIYSDKRDPTTATVFSEVGEWSGGDPSTGFTGAHEYSVLGFAPNPQNPQAARVTVQNPHRTMHWPNGQVTAGMIDHGQGRVEMSLLQFNDIFFNFSSAVPAPRREIPRLR